MRFNRIQVFKKDASVTNFTRGFETLCLWIPAQTGLNCSPKYALKYDCHISPKTIFHWKLKENSNLSQSKQQFTTFNLDIQGKIYIKPACFYL